MALENWGCVNEFKVNCSIFSSLMEDPQDQVENVGDEERLDRMIRSLEAEINAGTSDGNYQDSCSESDQSIGDEEEGEKMFSFEQMDGFDVNEFMDMETMPCSPSEEDMNLDVYLSGDEIMSNMNLVIGYEADFCAQGHSQEHQYGSFLVQEIAYDVDPLMDY